MCEERERLIGYVYDECDRTERQAIEEHLQTCHTCRREIRGLRDVRQDLLAWNVPDHESVWRPFASPTIPSPWRAVPVWAMAAAAAVILMVGGAGGAATYAFLPHGGGAQSTAPTKSAMATGSAEPVLTSLDERLQALERQNAALTGLVQTMSSAQSAPVDFLRISKTTEALTQKVNNLASQQEIQQELFQKAVLGAYAETRAIGTKQNALERNSNWMRTSIVQDQGPVGFGGGR